MIQSIFRRLDSVIGSITCRRSGIVVCAFVTMLVAGRNDARASHCGSYVIANPDRAGAEHSGKSRLGDRAQPRVPSPCEQGQCRSAPVMPFTPPSTTPVRPFEHLLLQTALEMDRILNQSPDFFASAARARDGFYRPLEHPPDAIGC